MQVQQPSHLVFAVLFGLGSLFFAAWMMFAAAKGRRKELDPWWLNLMYLVTFLLMAYGDWLRAFEVRHHETHRTEIINHAGILFFLAAALASRRVQWREKKKKAKAEREQAAEDDAVLR